MWGGIPYLVRDGETALLVAPGDALSMAAAAVRVLEYPVFGRRLRAAGLDAAQAYTWSRVRGKLFAVYAREIGAALPKEMPHLAGGSKAESDEPACALDCVLSSAVSSNPGKRRMVGKGFYRMEQCGEGETDVSASLSAAPAG